jgi:single-strand DNA-binding protein
MTIDTNRVFISGRLGADPELKRTASGSSYVRLSVAVHRRGRPVEEGQPREDITQWVAVVVWANQAESCAKYLQKGSAILVEGYIDVRSYIKDGDKRSLFQVTADRVQFIGAATNVDHQSSDYHNGEHQSGEHQNSAHQGLESA